jgi:hypothetical protein
MENCDDCSFKILMEEIKGMEELQSQADYVNLHTFKSFKVRLLMDDAPGRLEK